MQLRRLIVAALLPFALSATAAPDEHGKAEHFVIVVWDGMRPDFVTPEHAPTLSALARDGVFFRQQPSRFSQLDQRQRRRPRDRRLSGAQRHHFQPGVPARDRSAQALRHIRFSRARRRDGRISRSFIAVPTIVETRPKGRLPYRDRRLEAGRATIRPLPDSRKRDRARSVVVLSRQDPARKCPAERLRRAIGPFPKRKGFPNSRKTPGRRARSPMCFGKMMCRSFPSSG